MLKLQPEERADLAARVRRGNRARGFLASDFWKEDFSNWLAVQQKELGANTLWHPGTSPQCEAIALGCAFQGGRQDMIDRLLEIIKVWEVQGKEAATRIEKADGTETKS